MDWRIGLVVAALIEGVDSNDRDVVALLVDQSLRCTGTLIAPRVVLTAAHCVSDLPLDAISIGESLEGGVVLPIEEAMVHPGFDRRELEHDLALLLLREPVPEGTPIRSVATAPMTVREIGLEVRLVGFGATLSSDESPPRRHTGTARIGGLSELDFTVLPEPTRACSGDSGGPVLLAESIAGVISAGDGECVRYTRIARTDLDLDDFVRPGIDGASATNLPLGAPCFWGASCASGLCGKPAFSEREATCLEPCDVEGSACDGDRVCWSLSHGELGCDFGLPPDLEIAGGCRALPDSRPSFVHLFILLIWFSSKPWTASMRISRLRIRSEDCSGRVRASERRSRRR